VALAANISKVLLDEGRIQGRVRELGAEIARDYAGQRVIFVGILRGAVVFLADLIRALDAPVTIDFMAVSSYGKSTRSSGVVRISKDLNESIEGEHVVVVEDIIDSGLTLKYLVDLLRRRNPASLRVCTLLLKDRPRDHAVALDYVGFTIPDEFVVGYGLDYAGYYRNLPYIGVLTPEAIEAVDPLR
jgi:hypoxanthine phosphoribosyltransferase